VFFALDQVSDPVAHCSTGALVLSNVTVNVAVSPAPPKLSVDGSTVTSTPGRSTDAVNVPA
jgi:hypothetical protein